MSDNLKKKSLLPVFLEKHGSTSPKTTNGVIIQYGRILRFGKISPNVLSIQ